MILMDWKAKLTSRKFWAALASFVAMLVVAFGGSQETATQVTPLIMAGATVIAYIVGEGLVDAASAGADNITITDKQEPTEQGSATEEAAK